MIDIRYVEMKDKEFWFSLDRHLSDEEFEKKARDKQGYVMTKNDKPIGILRYHLFWDNTPFCTLLYISSDFQRNGYGSMLMRHWEDQMKAKGYSFVLTSTQVDENAQYFYRKLGYQDCGGLLLKSQPMELFMLKEFVNEDM